MKFCKECGSIVTLRKIEGQMFEFCNCQGKKEPKQQIITIKTQEKRKITVDKGKRLTKKPQKMFITIEESNVKPKQPPSKYQELELSLRLSHNANLPPKWQHGVVNKRLIEKTNETYERFYRDLETFFEKSELEVIIQLLPNATLTEFTIDFWGVGAIDPVNDELLIWYYGTKLNDRASWESKILEKLDDIILPKGYKITTSNLERLSLKDLCTILLKEWEKFKAKNYQKQFQKPEFNEIYSKFKTFHKQ